MISTWPGPARPNQADEITGTSSTRRFDEEDDRQREQPACCIRSFAPQRQETLSARRPVLPGARETTPGAWPVRLRRRCCSNAGRPADAYRERLDDTQLYVRLAQHERPQRYLPLRSAVRRPGRAAFRRALVGACGTIRPANSDGAPRGCRGSAEPARPIRRSWRAHYHAPMRALPPVGARAAAPTSPRTRDADGRPESAWPAGMPVIADAVRLLGKGRHGWR